MMVMKPVRAFSSAPALCYSRQQSFAQTSRGRQSWRRSQLMTRLWDSSNQEQQQSRPLSNQELVERRLAVNQAKRESRQRSVQERLDRNMKFKRLLHNDSTTNSDQESPFVVPPLYAVKIWVDIDLRQEMRLSGREKRGRVFLESGSKGVQTISGLHQELYGFFSALRKNTFLLSASVPPITADGKVESLPPKEGEAWTIETDDDVIATFQKADEFFHESAVKLQRPCIQINVLKNPNAPPPPPPPAYLEGMADPKQSETMTMLSFYAFPPQGIEDPEAFAFDIKKKWKPFGALGRVYVAHEGVNAQMSVPTNVLDNFMACCKIVPELGEHMENGINIDPQPLTMEEFQSAGTPVNQKPAPPFRNLHVRVRSQIVADGLDKSLDWQSAGYDMPPMEWHQKIKEARETKDTGDDTSSPIVLDCRNDYETEVGIFEGAEPLGTENFRDSWDVLKDRLKDAPKDAPIMTYCTGGIRCVKVGAYLTQEMGFTNVSRLAGGIIAYDRTLTEKTEDEESMFKGTNFVFDGRMGREITDDTLGTCATCGTKTNLVSNCHNENCHKRMIQCADCRTNYHGTCSHACKTIVIKGQAKTEEGSTFSETASETSSKTFESIDDYSVGHSTPAPSVYAEMEHNTRAHMPTGAHMVSGATQGRILAQLASMTREGRILELGTFTGYATVCFLEGARNVGQITGVANGNIHSGPYVMSLERDVRAFNIAAAHVQAVGEKGLGVEAAELVCAIRNQEVPSVDGDFVSSSLDGIAGCDLLRVTDALATVEEIASGNGSLNPAPFDLVFVDADKTRLLDYVDACLSNDRLLNKGGFIVVDNVLWKGLVVEASNGSFSSVADSPDDDKNLVKKNRRARKLANQMHDFNSCIVKDDRVEVVLFPVRDGLSVIRKK
ncbi:unnamed protein product [Cylindrotheca closterium]|uniref:Rhodanese domain-containing protein n=1 Tax=Cylindrotheca closterium TaxID=2856 RepID=A0AAD2JH33_9STRA|nr:unnamed protein product [Cylindrotheca closterium]